MTKLSEYRKQKDLFFTTDPHSPLHEEQKKDFTGLEYFSGNPSLDFDLEIEGFEKKEMVQIATSTGSIQSYTRYGKIKFLVDGKEYELTVFSSEHGFFIPFVDSQAGKETYGAGRYLDPHLLPNGKLKVDFNLAYNPYCAYNDLYSCPLPPAENRLAVAIKAGEMNIK